jgi:lipid A 3-O-deacylase
MMLLLFCSLAFAQQPSSPLAGRPWDYGFWASGGLSVPGGTKDTHMVDAGVRLGKVLTGDHLGGFMRGNFEWSADLMPAYYIWQPAPAKNAYGEAFNPVNLKWNFTRALRIVPFLELGGGVLFTNHAVPAGTSHLNFLPHGTFGLQLFNDQRRALTASVRFEHISNAGLTVPNPGVNSVQFSIGMNWFK